jgi:hypothetical protein
VATLRDRAATAEGGIRPKVPFIAGTIRKLSLLIILAWVALTLLLTFAVPSLEQVGREQSVPMSPKDAPSVQAMTRMGAVFQESDSDSMAMIVLEGQQPLGDEVRPYYDQLIRDLRNDPQHVGHAQDLWADRLTAAGAQSPDGKAVYVQLNLVGDQGTTLGQESATAVRHIVDRIPPPPGVEVFVTGPGALVGDMQHSGERSILKMTLIGAVIIFVVLLVVYRSVITVAVLLVTVAVELFAARGFVAFLGHSDVVLLSTFAINLLVALAMAAGTDYGIFFFGRYQEARQAGEDPEKGLLHHLPRGRPGGVGVRIDDRGRALVPELHPDADFPNHRRAMCRRHARRGRGRAHAGSCGSDGGKSLRVVRPHPQDRGPSMAPHRHGDRPLARAHFRGLDGDNPDRPGRASGLQDQLRRPSLHP